MTGNSFGASAPTTPFSFRCLLIKETAWNRQAVKRTVRSSLQYLDGKRPNFKFQFKSEKKMRKEMLIFTLAVYAVQNET